MRHREYPIFSVQYHPEASPGPHDASYFFDEFGKLMDDTDRTNASRLTESMGIKSKFCPKTAEEAKTHLIE